MTVKELKERLKGYPDDMLVVVEHRDVCVYKEESDSDSIGFDLIYPSIDGCLDNDLYEKYERKKRYVKENGEEWNSETDYNEECFHVCDTVIFKPKTDCTVKVTDEFNEAVLVIGEWNKSVDYPDVERNGENRCLESVLLIS